MANKELKLSDDPSIAIGMHSLPKTDHCTSSLGHAHADTDQIDTFRVSLAAAR